MSGLTLGESYAAGYFFFFFAAAFFVAKSLTPLPLKKCDNLHRLNQHILKCLKRIRTDFPKSFIPLQ